MRELFSVELEYLGVFTTLADLLLMLDTGEYALFNLGDANGFSLTREVLLCEDGLCGLALLLFTEGERFTLLVLLNIPTMGELKGMD